MQHNKPNNGGPAFPSATIGEYGMSLRDWFAAHANEHDICEFLPVTVDEAERLEQADGIKRTRQWARYQHADRMIAARNGGTAE